MSSEGSAPTTVPASQVGMTSASTAATTSAAATAGTGDERTASDGSGQHDVELALLLGAGEHTDDHATARKATASGTMKLSISAST